MKPAIEYYIYYILFTNCLTHPVSEIYINACTWVCTELHTRACVAATLPSPKRWLVNKFQHIPLLTIPFPAGLDHRPKPKPHITKLWVKKTFPGLGGGTWGWLLSWPLPATWHWANDWPSPQAALSSPSGQIGPLPTWKVKHVRLSNDAFSCKAPHKS